MNVSDNAGVTTIIHTSNLCDTISVGSEFNVR